MSGLSRTLYPYLAYSWLTVYLSGTAIGGAGKMELHTAATIAAEVIKTIGDPKEDLGPKLLWSMKEARRRIEEDPKSRISKAK